MTTHDEFALHWLEYTEDHPIVSIPFAAAGANLASDGLREIGRLLACDEADALIALLRATGATDAACGLFEGHVGGEYPEDSHWDARFSEHQEEEQ